MEMRRSIATTWSSLLHKSETSLSYMGSRLLHWHLPRKTRNPYLDFRILIRLILRTLKVYFRKTTSRRNRLICLKDMEIRRSIATQCCRRLLTVVLMFVKQAPNVLQICKHWFNILKARLLNRSKSCDFLELRGLSIGFCHSCGLMYSPVFSVQRPGTMFSSFWEVSRIMITDVFTAGMLGNYL